MYPSLPPEIEIFKTVLPNLDIKNSIYQKGNIYSKYFDFDIKYYGIKNKIIKKIQICALVRLI